MLGEQLVRLDVQRVRRHVPDDLIDADDTGEVVNVIITIVIVFAAQCAAKADQKHRLLRSRVCINRPIEWDRNASLQAETIQRVDHVEILAVRDMNRAVRVGEVHSASGVVRAIRRP